MPKANGAGVALVVSPNRTIFYRMEMKLRFVTRMVGGGLASRCPTTRTTCECSLLRVAILQDKTLTSDSNVFSASSSVSAVQIAPVWLI